MKKFKRIKKINFFFHFFEDLVIIFFGFFVVSLGKIEDYSPICFSEAISYTAETESYLETSRSI
jgi:hypothetical protein